MAEGAERFRGLWEDEMLHVSLSRSRNWLFTRRQTEWHDRCVAVFRVVVAGRYLVCRFN